MAKTLFEQQLGKKILVLDGAMGTMIQRYNLTADDFGGENYEGCNEYLTITAPWVIEEIHRVYFEAGADIIETNTFGATRIVLEEYQLGHLSIEINRQAARLARKVCDEVSTNEWPRFVAGSIGPTTKTLSVTGGVSFDNLIMSYQEQAIGLLEGGVDLLLVETSQDVLNVKAAYIGIQHAFQELNQEVPIIISGTIEPMGTTLAGQNIEAFYLSVEHMHPAAVGLNCATGPEFMTDHVRSLSSLATTAVICYPNAGLPDEEGHYHESPKSLAKKLAAFAEKGWLNIIGGCCGTTPEHIRAIVSAIQGDSPREIAPAHPHAVSGIEALIYDPSMRPILVGERTNVIGSRKFKRLISEGKYEEASEIARAQVKGGAHVIDICVADPDRNELEDMEHFLQYVTKKIKVPLMIDSTDEAVIERALTYSQGKAIINSINLEDGEERFEKIVPLIKKYGAAVVVGTIAEEGMAVKSEDKLRIAVRSYDLLVNKYGLHPEDLIFDPLVFPLGTGDQQYIGSAKETIDGIKQIKGNFPQCMTILGISNVSFGLPAVGREILNSVFLYHCTLAGLDYAIVNSEKLERFASIPEEERKLAEALIFDTNEVTLAAFTAFYREKKAEVKAKTTSLSLEERLANYVVEGTKEGLWEDLEQALAKYADPLDIINGPLMAGMKEVGRLFNDNQLIVAEVLQSAEVMKASVAYLEPFMEKREDAEKGKVLLATVKGDVHDIGKNLVDIILSNNGYNVVDLGIKVTPSTLIEAVHREKPDIIGLSGLLVKSAQQMVVTAQDLREANITSPILVGGAALSKKFTEKKIDLEYEGLVMYAKDAMDGLSLTNYLQSLGQEEKEKLLKEKKEKLKHTTVKGQDEADQSSESVVPQRSEIPMNPLENGPPDLERHVLRNYSLSHIENYINLQMLLGHHLGVKGKVDQLLEEKDEKTLRIYELVQDILKQLKEDPGYSVNGVYQFFPAQADGVDIIVYDPKNEGVIIERFTFPRQRKAPYLCLADYLRPVSSGQMDYIGFLAVTCGAGIRERALVYKEKGDFLRSHALQATALELAEAFAERLHHIMRDRWGFPDPVDFTMKDRFSAKYQGQRYSFGYPACPNLEDQEKLFRLLKPQDIGIQLTDGFMMEPEASVTALVVSHPQARYFNVL